MRLSPDIRGAFRKLTKQNLAVSNIANMFNTTRQTVHRWLVRGNHRGSETFKDKPRQPKESKVTIEVELSILKLRTAFKWGTARVQQGLYNLPRFILDSVQCVQGVKLSRETMNNVLTRNNQNGYQREFKRWKFFRAKEPDELWQIDFKGPFTVGGKNYWFLVCIDDYSRFIVCAEQFDHQLTTADTTAVLEKQKRLPKAILSDHGSQFRDLWKSWCSAHGVEAHFAHPSYPQDKGKVERCIQNLNREFINPLRKFPGWLKGKLTEYKDWFNHSRFHRGVKAFPADLYECRGWKLDMTEPQVFYTSSLQKNLFMKSEKIVGYVLIAVGLAFVVFPMWLAYSILLGGKGLPQLIPTSGTDETAIFYSNLINVLLTFFIFIIVVWAGSIISSRGVTLVREVKLKVARESVGEEVVVVKKEEAEKPSS